MFYIVGNTVLVPWIWDTALCALASTVLMWRCHGSTCPHILYLVRTRVCAGTHTCTGTQTHIYRHLHVCITPSPSAEVHYYLCARAVLCCEEAAASVAACIIYTRTRTRRSSHSSEAFFIPYVTAEIIARGCAWMTYKWLFFHLHAIGGLVAVAAAAAAVSVCTSICMRAVIHIHVCECVCVAVVMGIIWTCITLFVFVNILCTMSFDTNHTHTHTHSMRLGKWFDCDSSELVLRTRTQIVNHGTAIMV